MRLRWPLPWFSLWSGTQTASCPDPGPGLCSRLRSLRPPRVEEVCRIKLFATVHIFAHLLSTVDEKMNLRCFWTWWVRIHKMDNKYFFFQNIISLCFFFHKESWILYSGKNEGVSQVVKDAYQKYENREFGTKLDEIHLDNRNRHIKLINITDNEVR